MLLNISTSHEFCHVIANECKGYCTFSIFYHISSFGRDDKR